MSIHTITDALRLSPQLPRLDREVLLSHLFGQSRTWLITHDDSVLTARTWRRYRGLLARAEQQEPIAYIIGEKEFYGRKFSVGPGVLIPRPETELLVEHTVRAIGSSARSQQKIAVVDVGTGSGAIIVNVLLSLTMNQRKNISWFAVDSEEVALRYARKNAKHLGASPMIQFMKSDLLSRLSKKLSRYDRVFVIANLPYLSDILYRSAKSNVRRYEPKSALLSGTDGLDHYHRLMTELCVLSASGIQVNFFLEISPEQAKKLHLLSVHTSTLRALTVLPDLAGKSRFVIGTLR